MSGARIIPLGNITRLDLPAERVLEAAKEHLEHVVLMGWDKEGKLYFASTFSDGGDVLWIVEQCKRNLLSGAD
jgi:hypothetical protein